MDLDLGRKLQEEASGIAAWVVRGAMEYHAQGGLKEPQEVIDNVKGYREREDLIGEFLRDRCIVHPDAMVSSIHLYYSYKDWAKDAGVRSMNEKNFSPIIEKEKKLIKKRGYRFHGLKFKGIQVLISESNLY